MICAKYEGIISVRLRRAESRPNICRTADNDGRDDGMSANSMDSSTTVLGRLGGNLLHTMRTQEREGASENASSSPANSSTPCSVATPMEKLVISRMRRLGIGRRH